MPFPQTTVPIGYSKTFAAKSFSNSLNNNLSNKSTEELYKEIEDEITRNIRDYGVRLDIRLRLEELKKRTYR